MGIRLNCLSHSSGELTIDFRLIINICTLQLTIYMLYSKCNENTKMQHVFLIELFIINELFWQLNQIRSMVTLDMHYCALKQQNLQLEAGAHKHN